MGYWNYESNCNYMSGDLIAIDFISNFPKKIFHFSLKMRLFLFALAFIVTDDV